VLPVTIPPLRERPEDIGPLAEHFVESLCRDLGQSTRTVAPDALRALEHYGWPGNARELENVIERVLLMEDDSTLRLEHLPPEFQGLAPQRGKSFVLPAAGFVLDEIERDFICQALDRVAGNKTRAARLLGLSRDTLRYRLEKYGIPG
jgi:DNA-binding NtrC family response regulator